MFEIYCDYAKLLFEACKFRLLSIRFLFFLGKVEKINVHKGFGPAYIMNDISIRRHSGSIRIIYQGFGPAYGGDEFVRLKEIPPAVVAARASGRWLLCLLNK